MHCKKTNKKKIVKENKIKLLISRQNYRDSGCHYAIFINYNVFKIDFINQSMAYSEPRQASKLEFLAKIVKQHRETYNSIVKPVRKSNLTKTQQNI